MGSDQSIYFWFRQCAVTPSDRDVWQQLAITRLPSNPVLASQFNLRAMRLAPPDGPAALLFGRAFAQVDAGSACDHFRRVLIANPGSRDVVLDYGVILFKEQRWRDSFLWFKRSESLEVPAAVSCFYKGVSAARLGLLSDALRYLQTACELDSARPTNWYNRGIVANQLEQFDEAIACFDRSTILDPENVEALYNSALSFLMSRRFLEGWRRHEYRWRSLQFFNIERRVADLQTARRRFCISGDIGCRVLVWGEQGVGDEVMFGSMLSEFRGYVGKLLVQLDRRLIPLFKRSLPDDVEFFERGTVVPEDRYDSHIAIGSLGQYLRPTLESFEGKGGKYLWADPERVQAMREWLSVKEGEHVIGLSWRSSNPETGAARSLALKDLVKSLQAPGVRFVNLQYGEVSAEIEALERDEGIQVLECPGLDTTDDLDGLAALIEACDEVVSIGNATAHLAGALGKKTIVLLPKARSWRWLFGYEQSLWYQVVILKVDALIESADSSSGSQTGR
jgi:tetratricopeptide (TPR) repeat protein